MLSTILFFLQHRHLNSVPSGCINCLLITGICVADYSQTRICGQHSFQSGSCSGCAVCNNHLSGVLTESNPDPAAVVEGNPGCSSDSIQHGV